MTAAENEESAASARILYTQSDQFTVQSITPIKRFLLMFAQVAFEWMFLIHIGFDLLFFVIDGVSIQ
jgi:hypothetical protein